MKEAFFILKSAYSVLPSDARFLIWSALTAVFMIGIAISKLAC